MTLSQPSVASAASRSASSPTSLFGDSVAKSAKALRGEVERRELIAEAIRVPANDWPRIRTGRATEFRIGHAIAPVLKPLPTMAILYCRDRARAKLETRLMFVEDRRDEPLGAISEEGLARAGYPGARAEAFARFRREWKISHRKFNPMQRMAVYTVRPIQESDVVTVGTALVSYLYGELLAAPQQTRTVQMVPQF